MLRSHRRNFNGRPRRGFTLMETALAIVIVATGVLAIMYAQQAYHRQYQWATNTSTGVFLANEIREMTAFLPRHDPVTGAAFWGPESNEAGLMDFDDLDDFDGSDGKGMVFSAESGTGPVNARREIIPNLPGWSQTVRVYNVDPQDISAPGDDDMDGTTRLMRVEVVVNYLPPGQEEAMTVVRDAWLATR